VDLIPLHSTRTLWCTLIFSMSHVHITPIPLTDTCSQRVPILSLRICFLFGEGIPSSTFMEGIRNTMACKEKNSKIRMVERTLRTATG